MKFISFLFLQFFIAITSGFYVKVRRIFDAEETKKKNNTRSEYIDYNPKTILDDEEVYVFIREENGRYDIIYWLGARAKRTKILNAITCAVATRYSHIEKRSIENVYITRETSKPGINTFEDLMLAKVPEKIPRLYKVTEGHTIRQVPLESELDMKNSYVLDDGFSVTIHHSPTCEMNRKIADSLKAYIINVENGGNYNLSNPFSSGNEENSETDFETFRDKISSIVNVYSKSKTDVLPKNEVGRSKAVSKKYKAKDKNSTKKDDKYFEERKVIIHTFLHFHQLPIQTDSSNRASSTASTSSTAAAATHVYSRKKSKTAKRKTSLKETVHSSLLESEFTNAFTTSTTSDSENNKYKNVIPIFMGSEECVPKPLPLPIDTLKPMCIYSLKDLENYEILIYLGQNVDILRQQTAIQLAELDIDENSLWKLTIVLQGNKIPTPFMIHIKSEIDQYLLA